MDNEITEHPDPAKWWFHRRVMAYGGLIFSALAWAAGLVLSVLMPDHAASTVHPLTTSALWAGLVPMTLYIGDCAIEAFARVKNG